MDTEIDEVTRKITRVDQQIEDVEEEVKNAVRKIEDVEGELKNAARKADVSYWRRKEEQLRRKEEQLRRKEEQLRRKEEQLRRKEEQLREEKLLLVKASTSDPAQESQDSSEVWVTHMLLPELPPLPRNKNDLEKILYPEQHRKLPVSPTIYAICASHLRLTAEKLLLKADSSIFPGAVGNFLVSKHSTGTTEPLTSMFIGNCFLEFFTKFNEYSEHRFDVQLFFNSTEKLGGSTSPATLLRTRPDTIAVASGCTFLVGEDKRKELSAAVADLSRKILPLNRMFYGKVNCILGYIAAGSRFQWVYIGQDGKYDIHPIGRILDLANTHERCIFLLSLGYAFQLLRRMADSVPEIPGRRAMYSVDESTNGERKIWFHSDHLVKHIKDFDSYSSRLGTNLSEIQNAYTAAESCRFLPQQVSPPSLTPRGIYTVAYSPLGYLCSLKSEKDCRWMARCVCEALSTLHDAGLVHRDVRLQNIVRLSEQEFMLIDLESVAEFPFRLFPGFQYFSGWRKEMLEGDLYTPNSDMCSLGGILDREIPIQRTSAAQDFIGKLTGKQLSASLALQHPWLSDLGSQF